LGELEIGCLVDKLIGNTLDSTDTGDLKIRRNPEGIIFNVFVQPRSSKNAVVGLHGDAIKIKLTAPPVDNAANKMCLKFLAKELKVSKSSIKIVAGHTSRNKQVLLKDDHQRPTAIDYHRLENLIKSLL
jgi:uncharacterized protein (TIGR00251 family)